VRAREDRVLDLEAAGCDLRRHRRRPHDHDPPRRRRDTVVSFRILPDGIHQETLGGGRAVAQVVFTPDDWDVRGSWTSPPSTTSSWTAATPRPGLRAAGQPHPRAALIDGGVSGNCETFLNNPALLPGETNKPVPTGFVGTGGTPGRPRRRSAT
jgi:hypothetical protein